MAPSRAVTEVLRLTAVALQFLTRIPVPRVRVEDGDLRRAAAAFPLVGLVVAAVAIAVRAALAPWWGPATATVAAVVAATAVTGAFHEDGLADTVDGVWGGWDPAQRLAIMRDSRVGTYGVLALVGTFALRVVLLAPLPLLAFAQATVAGHVLGRASGLVLSATLPALAPGHGARVAGRPGVAGTAVAGATVAAALGVGLGRFAPVPLVAGLAVVGATRRLYRRRLGGVTGDTLGATNQLVDLVAVAAVVGLARAGLLS